MSVAQIFAGLQRTPLLAEGGTVNWQWQQGLNALAKAVNAPVSPSIPQTSSDPGDSGQIAADASYLYVCVGPNQWVRAALSAF